MFKLATGSLEDSVMQDFAGQTAERFLLWVDAVGGYWVCLGDVVTLGQPTHRQVVDVPILGDLASRHARIRRDGEGYLIEAIRDVRVDGRPVRGVVALGDGSQIQLGSSVRLVFRRPHALSATARLDFVSRHRTQPSADAVILMADSCVLSPKEHGHVVCRQWPEEVILYRYDDELYCRGPQSLEIDGVKQPGRGPITKNSRIVGRRFSMNLEEI